MPIYHIRPDRERPPGWEILSFADIHVFVQPSFLLFIGLIFLTNMEAATANPDLQRQALSRAGLFGFIVFFSLLAHEFGHALMCRLFGQRDINVSLIFFGGVTQHQPTTRGRNLLITLAGPIASITLCLGAWALLRSGMPWTQQGAGRFIVGNFFFLNMIWAIFNLLPIFPMDGGRTVLFLLTWPLREPRAWVVTALISLATCAGLMALFISKGGRVQDNFILIYLLITFVMSNVQILRDQWPRW